MLPIVDTHQHLWDLDRFSLPWLQGVESLRKSHLMSDYLQAAEGLNIVKTLYMEVDVDPRQRVAEVEYVSELCRRSDNPMCGAIIAGNPGAEDFAQYLGRFAENPWVKGVRQVLHVPSARPGTCLEKSFAKGVRLLGERGLSFDLCLRPRELGDGIKLVNQCPDTLFVLDHCGNPDPQIISGAVEARAIDQSNPFWHERESWQRHIEALGKRENAVCKISGIAARVPRVWSAEDLAPTVNHCLDSFGPERVIFGGDWPVCTLGASLRQWVEALGQIAAGRSEEAQRKLMHDNALRLFRLE
jgi:L-fuconolactonase